MAYFPRWAAAAAGAILAAATIDGLIIDNFAGGGGASTGIEWATGRSPDYAVNHDDKALAMHRANHPATIHISNNIRRVVPLEVTQGRKVGLAWFSPDCTDHSKAKGGVPRQKKIRDLAWVVIRWAYRARPDAIMLENVEEFQDWGPLKKGKVIKSRRGETFKLWIQALVNAGYVVDYKELRACDYGAPTIRKRLFLIARRDGKPIVWPAPTHGRIDSLEVASGVLKPYRTAAECIDWTIPCPSIFDRRKPLVEATLKRIAHGVMRFVVNNPRPFIIPVTHHGSPDRGHDLDDQFRTVTGANRGEQALVSGTLVKNNFGSNPAQDALTPLHTATTQPNRFSAVAATMVQTGYGEREGQAPRTLDIEKPLGTVVSGGGKHSPVTAYLAQHNGGKVGHEAETPVSTVTTTGRQQQVVAASLTKFSENNRGKPVDVPLDTAMAGAARHGVVAAHLSKMASGNAPTSAEEPTQTIEGHSKTAEVAAFLTQFRGSNKRGGGGGLDQPGPGQTAGGMHQGVVCAHIEQANTGMVGHHPKKPISTIIGKGCTQRIVHTTLVANDALPPDMMNKAVRTAAFLIKYYGAAEHGQTADEPLHSATGKARFAVVTVTIDATTYVLVDIGMRMLTPRELFNAQGFPPDYDIEAANDNGGKPLTKTQQIEKCGNSVCPQMSEALVRANFGATEEQEERKAA